MNSTQEIIAAADGSALGNPGPAGWAWYIDDDHWASGGWAHGTNNMGELKAVLDLFEATASRPEAKLRVYCDSQYVINSLTKWMPGWKKKGWKKSDGKPVLNRDLLEALDQALTGRDYEFIWVKGHAGHELNEKADSLANGAARAYQEGREPAHGPGFGTSAEPAAVEPVEAPAVEAPIVNAPAAEPVLSESSADAHLPVQEFTAAEIENAQRGVESLRLSGLLRPASAVNAPDPEAVRARKEQLALAAERAAERDAKALARQQETAQQASTAAQAEEEDDLTGLEEFAGLDPNDVDPAELLGETEAHAEEQAVDPAAEPALEPAAAPAQTVESAQVEAPVEEAPASEPAPAPNLVVPNPVVLNPEEAAAAEQLLESRGSVMEAAQLESMLHERLVWVTATGKSVSRSSVLQYRERAFTQQGAPLKQGVQVLDSSSVLVMAAVATARGRVSRSSIWHYDAERGLWRLRFRQETPAA